MNFNEIKSDYEEYSKSYNSLIGLLSEIISNGEITNDNKGSLDRAYSDYGNNLMNVKRSMQTSKDTILEDRLAALENNKLDATPQSVANALTNGGRNNSVFVDENGRLFIDGEYIPKLTLVELDVQRLQADYAEITELVVQKATIEDLKATNAEITNLKANKADIFDLNATNANVENLVASKANVEDLNATNANITNLEANKANVTDLNATNANITNLEAIKANIVDLEVATGNISTLTSELAKVNTLVNGNLTSDNIHSLILTGEKVTVENGFIKNAMIDSLDAKKINTGELDTNLVNIKSSDGSLTLNGSLQQFKDENDKVRIQMGKDALGKFSFTLLDETGVGTIIDSQGITEKAIGTGLIVNEMINDNANISGNKMDIDSVIREVNENGVETLKSSKIKVNEANQTLDIAFNELKTQADDTKQETSTNTASIKVAQGQIATLISDTTIISDGETKTLKDAYNSTVNTINSMNTTIGEHKTIIDENTGKVTDVTASVAQIKTDLSGIDLRVGTTESSITTVTTDLSKVDGKITDAIDTSKGYADGLVATVNETMTSKEAAIKLTTDSISQRVSDTESSITTVTTANEKLNTGLDKWLVERFNQPYPPNPLTPTIDDVVGKVPYMTFLIEEGSNAVDAFQGYLGRWTTNLYLDDYYRLTTNAISTHVGTLYLNANVVATTNTTAKSVILDFVPGWNKITWVYNKNLDDGGCYLSTKLSSLPQVKIMTAYDQTNIDEEMISVSGKLDVTKSKVAEIVTDLDSITQRVSSTESTTTTITTDLGKIDTKISDAKTAAINAAATDATSKADAAKTDAISTAYSDATIKSNAAKNAAVSAASLDATRKANNAITEAMAGAKGYTDGQVKIVSEAISQKVADIKLTTDAIDLRVASTESNITTVTTDLSKVDGKISDAKGSAITTAASDATSKANAAKTDAINSASADATSKANGALTSAKGYVDGQITTVNETITKKEADIKLTTDAIALRVSSTESNITTTTTELGKVDGKISDAKTQAIKDSRTISDTRSKNENPLWYFTNYPKQTINEFKTANIIGIGSTAIYGALETKTPWTDKSGGYPVQTFRSNSTPTYERKGTSDTTWGAWSQIEDTVGAQAKATKALSDANSFTTTEVEKTNKKVSEIVTDLNAITLRVGSSESSITTVTESLSKVDTKISDAKTAAINSAASDATAKANSAKTSAVSTAASDATSKANAAQAAAVSTASSDATAKANSAKTDAINTASSDATSKANAAQTNATTAAKNYTDGQVKTVNETIASKEAAIKLTTDSIALRVSTTETNIKTIDGNVTGLTTRMKTAENKITDDSITNLVKKNFYTKTETENTITSKGYQISSQVQQTVDAFELKFEQSGGYNLFRNSAFKNGQANWIYNRWDTAAGGTAYIEVVYPQHSEWTPGNRNSLGACITGLPTSSSGKALRCGFDSHLFSIKASTTYTLNCLMSAHRVNSYTIEMLCFDASGNRITDDNHSVVVTNVKSGGRDRNNWNKIKHTFTTQSNAVTCQLRAFMNQWNGEHSTAYMWICEPIITEGNVDIPWTPNADEMYTGITTIDSDGITVNMIEGESSKGYSKVSHQGITTYDSNGTTKSWFSDDNAYIRELNVDNINNKYLIQCKPRNTNWFVGQNAKGNGTGIDYNNKSNSINSVLEYIKNNYGCYSFRQDIAIYCDDGVYHNENIYIGGWLGPGQVIIHFGKNSTLVGTILVEECVGYVVIDGGTTSFDNNDGCKWYRTDGLTNGSALTVRSANVSCNGFRSHSNHSTYGYPFATILNGGVLSLYANDLVKYWSICRMSNGSTVYIHATRGDIGIICEASDNSTLVANSWLPICDSGKDPRSFSNSFGQWNGSATINSLWYPKAIPEAPAPVVPPAPTKSWHWAEKTFYFNLSSTTEGSGSATTNWSDKWGQGSWGIYKSHRGHAKPTESISGWCAVGSNTRNISMILTMTRLNTNHGQYGAIPVPKLKQKDGSYWNSGTAFALGNTKSITLSSGIVAGLSDGTLSELTMWAGSTNNDYSQYNNVSLKVTCEKYY